MKQGDMTTHLCSGRVTDNGAALVLNNKVLKKNQILHKNGKVELRLLCANFDLATSLMLASF